MKIKKYRYFVGDFETTVYDGQEDTEVWASASVELFHDEVKIFHSIEEQFNYFKSLKENIICYYHNLKFDGAFWLAYFLVDLGMEQAFTKLSEDENKLDIEWLKDNQMKNNTFKYSISDRGQWYSIIVKVNNHYIEFRDSLKLLPFSVDRIGNSFATKHQKLFMEYKGLRYAGCPITEQEKEYIANDVLVVKEALEIMFNEGHDKLTIGSCCLAEYKNICKTSLNVPMEYKEMFPNIYDMEFDSGDKVKHTYNNMGEWVRKSYKGGWCYLVKGKENQIYYNGTTADVNSLYPSMMHSESGNKYPIGNPHFWYGDFIPDIALRDDVYYFVRIKTRFYLKEGKLPFIQIKGNPNYKGTECLESSDVYIKEDNTGEVKRYTHIPDKDGKVISTRVELTLTMTDYQLLKDHYNLVEFEIIDGCWFYACIGLFDDYIDKYKHMKLTSKDARKELAKLFLNNLYGKLSSSTDSSFKFAYVKLDKTVGFMPVKANDKQPGYIPCGSAITSYARNFTIRAAQKNYHGVDSPGFIYADTDSIHCDLLPEQIQGITVDDKEFCCWKLEAQWDIATFTRQKTYIEHVTHENLKEVEEPYYNIKCAGMPQRCKDLLDDSLDGYADIYGYVDKKTKEVKEWTQDEKTFMFNYETKKPIKRTLSDFRAGLKVPGKLLPKTIRGGVLLVDTLYEMR